MERFVLEKKSNLKVYQMKIIYLKLRRELMITIDFILMENLLEQQTVLHVQENI